jgi:hypothetical protein
MTPAFIPCAVMLLAVATAANGAGRNLALGRPYTLLPAPNYALCTDPNDKTQLTDGQHAGPDTFWGQPATVGWQTSNPVQIVIDLGAVAPIEGIAFSTASRLNAAVVWPTIIVGVSDDGATYRIAAHMTATPVPNQDQAREYRQRIAAAGLRTRARFVMFYLLPGGPYLFCDEVEVIAGAHDPATVEMRGRAVTAAGFRAYVALARHRAWVARQYERVAQQAREAAVAAGRAETSSRLRAIADELQALAARIPAARFDRQALNRARRDLASLCAQANAALRNDGRYCVWQHDPWVPLSPFEVVAPGKRSPQWLEVHAASNEYSSAAVTITNATADALRLRARLEDLHGDGAAVSAAEIALRRLQFVEAGTGDYVADALPLMDDRGLRLAPGETSQIWLTLPRRRLRPGRYCGRLLLQADQAPASRAIAIVLRVYPVELPDQPTLQTYNWAYVNTFPLVRGLEREAVADLFAHYTNTFVFSGLDVPWPTFDAAGKGSIDFTAHDRNLALHRGAREVAWFWAFSDGAHPDGGRFGADYLGPQWKERFAWWLRAWVAHLKELGCGYDEFFMYPFDETLCDRFRDLARFIKEVDPDIRIFADPVSDDTRQRIQAIASDIDIWCPHLFTFEQRPDDLRYLRARAKKLWTYVCSGPAKALPPHGYYRLMMWRAWRYGFTGCGFWAYADAGWTSGNAWDDFDGTHHDFAVIYTGRNAPAGVPRAEAIIPSKRWEAWRAGVQDYELLRLAADAARRAEHEGRTDKAATLREAVQRAVDAALAAPDDPSAVESARRRLLAAF